MNTMSRVRQCVCIAPCPHHKGRCEEMVDSLRCRCCIKAQDRAKHG